MPGGRATTVGIGGKAVLSLGHTDRQIAITLCFPIFQLIADLAIGQHLIGAIDALGNGFDLFKQRHVIGVKRRELRGATIDDLDHAGRQILGPGRAMRPMLAQDRLGTMLFNIILDRRHFGIGIGDKMVDRHHRRHAKLLDVLDVLAKVGTALGHGRDIFVAQVVLGDAAVHLHRTYRGDNHHCIRRQTGLATLDVHELFGTQIGAEPSLGHHIIRQLQRGGGGDDRVTAMRDIGERAAMHKGGVVFQRLHDVGLHRLLQQHRHRAIGLDVAGKNRRAIAAIGDDDVTKSLFKVSQIIGQAQNSHDFGRHGDVKPSLTRETVGHTAKVTHDLTQGAVIHVQHALIGHPADVNFLLVAPVNVVVQQRGQQVVRGCDRVEVTGEMKVHILHRDNLRVTTARSAALHAKARPKRGFADTDRGVLADGIQTVAQTHGGGGLTLARRGRVDRRHQDQLAIGPVRQRFDELFADLGLVMAKRQQMVAGDAKLCADFLNRLFIGSAGDFDVRHVGFS